MSHKEEMGLMNPGVGPGAWRLCRDLGGMKFPTHRSHFAYNQHPLVVKVCTGCIIWELTTVQDFMLPKSQCGFKGAARIGAWVHGCMRAKTICRNMGL